jgi:hypothetical protein
MRTFIAALALIWLIFLFYDVARHMRTHADHMARG